MIEPVFVQLDTPEEARSEWPRFLTYSYLEEWFQEGKASQADYKALDKVFRKRFEREFARLRLVWDRVRSAWHVFRIPEKKNPKPEIIGTYVVYLFSLIQGQQPGNWMFNAFGDLGIEKHSDEAIGLMCHEAYRQYETAQAEKRQRDEDDYDAHSLKFLTDVLGKKRTFHHVNPN